ncbi:MAG: glycosyl hydrolase [Victivallaceae bacterium]
MLEKLLKQVAEMPSEFRGAPFWAWNGKLEPEELRRQIRIFKEMGLGGFFMHSRVGLDTEYLGKEWFECVRACIDEAKKLGMMAWLYDEDRWPSGAAGGIVTKDPEFRQRQLRLRFAENAELPELGPQGKLLGVFAARLDGRTASAVRRFAPATGRLDRGETMLVISEEAFPASSWFNGEAYLDTMNPAAVQKFIEVTHEAYRREIGDEFGKAVPGIFTDEPNYLHGHLDSQTAWTPALPAKFREVYGYDLLDHLVELFLHVDGEEFSRARCDYRALATVLYVRAFGELIGEWCGRNHLEMTGHNLAEDNLVSQTLMVGAAMPLYEFMQAPGIDLLTEHWGIFNTAKQLSSMARQFGRSRRLSETYGCTGWDFPFAGHKALGDWQYACGINYRCQHLAWYTMAAEAKRDYPASISCQSPWFDRYGAVEAYFARLGAALESGGERRDLLVIHPIESTWGVFAPWTTCERGKDAAGEATPGERWREEETRALARLTNPILAANIDFDFGDEEVMSRHAGVKDSELQVGIARYRAVLIPRLRTIRASTLKLLADFVRAGGTVGYYGAIPERVDAQPSDAAKAAYRLFTPVKEDDFANFFSPAARTVSIADGAGREIAPALYMLRESEDADTLFICNHGVEFSDDDMKYGLVRDRKLAFPEVTVKLFGGRFGQVYELDLNTGRWQKLAAKAEGGTLALRTSLDELGSRLFVFTDREIPGAVAATAAKPAGSMLALASTPVPVRRDEPNVLVLDHFDYELDGVPAGQNTYFIAADDEVRKHLGVAPRGGAMVQPWLRGKRPVPAEQVKLKQRYRFRVETRPQGELFFAVERPDLYTVTLNGRTVEKREAGHWCDLSLRKLKLDPAWLVEGENLLELDSVYHGDLPGLESAFLLGEFGVRETALVAPPVKLVPGDWVPQGLPHYAGNLTYFYEVEFEVEPERARLEIPDYRGVALEIAVNGGAPVLLPWPPYQLEIGAALKAGKNIIAITVLGHRRNSHGPFYLDTKWPSWTGPHEYHVYTHPAKQLVPCGLFAAPVLKIG